ESVSVAAGGSVEVKPNPSPKPQAPAPVPVPVPAASSSPPAQHVAPPPPPPEPARPSKRSEGLSPIWFWVGTALTVGAGAATVWSGLDTQSKHDAFNANKNPATQSDGTAAQLRTNLLLVITAACGITTASLGIFAVSWSKGPTATVGGRF